MSDIETFEVETASRSHSYQIVLILLSMAAVSWYHYRVRKHSRKAAFAKFTCGASAMALWNLLQTMFSSQMLFSVATMVHYKKIIDEEVPKIPWTYSSSLHNDDVNSKINYFCLLKDLRMTGLSMISVACFYYLTRTGVKHLREHSEEVSEKEEWEYEQQFEKTDRISKKALIATLMVVLLLSTQFIPTGMLLSSSSILYKSEWFVLRYDHIYFTMFAMFALVNCRIIYRWMKRKPSFFFKGALMVPLGFVWSYCSCILFVALVAMILFNDTLVNICTLRFIANDINEIYQVTLQEHLFKISTFSSFVLAYMSHTAGPQDTFTKDFAGIRDIFQNSWLVLNMAYLVVLPWLLFVVVDHRYSTQRKHIV